MLSKQKAIELGIIEPPKKEPTPEVLIPQIDALSEAIKEAIKGINIPEHDEKSENKRFLNISDAIDKASKRLAEKSDIVQAITALISAVNELKKVDRSVTVNVPERKRPTGYKVVRDRRDNITEVIPQYEDEQ